jgi:hypothetical protein
MRTCLTLGLLLSASVSAQVYTWVDAQGETHYTDDRAAVPAGVKPRTSEGADIAEVPAPPRPATPPPGAWQARSEVSASSRPDESAAREKWRAAFRTLHERIHDLEQDIEVDRKQVDETGGLHVDARYSCVSATTVTGVPTGACYTRRNGEFERIKARLQKNRQELAHKQEALADLERQAANENIPFEWRR